MEVINTRNVHQALPEAIRRLEQFGVDRESRNGPVRQFKEPVTTCYFRPDERVIFWPTRDANPFFHFFEALWMLAGRNDIAFPASFVPRFRDYSDDGVTQHGAYGHRWRRHFGTDQLSVIIAALKKNPEDRRCVLSMWDANVDLARQGVDVPCNTTATVYIDPDGRLCLTVFNRSNDIIWGAYGSNAVHFSMLQEFIAAGVGAPLGTYHQVSTNFHAYHATLKPLLGLADEAADVYSKRLSPYETGQVEPHPMVQTPLKEWQQDLAMMLEEGVVQGLRDPFFRRVATPLFKAHQAYQSKKDPDRHAKALEILEQCAATDWRLAATEWVQRRVAKTAQKQAAE